MSKERWSCLYKDIEDLIQKVILEPETKQALLTYYKECYVKQPIINNVQYEREYLAWIYATYILERKKIENLNWDFLCYIYNVDLITILEVNRDRLLEQRELLDRAFKAVTEQNYRIGGRLCCKIICELYSHLAFDSVYEKKENILHIRKYKKLLIKELRPKAETPELNYVINHFNEGSHYSEIFQVETIGQNNERIKVNINVYTSNKFIQRVLKLWLSLFLYSELQIRDLRIFIFYFMESLGHSKELRGKITFNQETFLTQYKFYTRLAFNYYTKYSWKLRFIELLVKFYRQLIYNFENEPDTVDLSPVFKQAIMSKNFYRYFKKGYEFVYYNPLETPPKSDKVCILPNTYTLQNTYNGNNLWISMNLTDIPLEFKQDIKSYVWNSNTGIRTSVKSLVQIKKFLKVKKSYENISCIEIKDEKIFTSDFLWEYRNQLEMEIANSATLKNNLKAIRKYLNFHKNKYKVTTSDMKILSLKGLETFKGGKPLTKNDSKLIYRQFQEAEKAHKNGELYTIVFEIFMLSNLRIGEIVNLKRDCVVKREKDGKGEIYYLSKNSNQEGIYQTLSPTVMDLIQKAINITTPIVYPNHLISNYIFIESYQSDRIKHNKRINFSWYFKKIISSIHSQLEVKNYVPYNIRHTFIDNIYKEGIKEDLSINEIALLTGNSYKTANQYYRKRHDIELYVEAMSKVIFSDVDIHGNILVGEKKANQNIVKNNLGNCRKDSCVFEIGECLLCKHFVTFTNRIPAFENLIEHYNIEIENTNNQLEIKELNVQKKLLSRYLVEMYKIQLS